MSLDRPNPPLYLVRTFFVLFVALSARVVVEYGRMAKTGKMKGNNMHLNLKSALTGVFAFSASCVLADNWYIGPNGSDDNYGNVSSAPLKNLNNAWLGKYRFHNNDNFYFLPGTNTCIDLTAYASSSSLTFNIIGMGTSENPTVIDGEDLRACATFGRNKTLSFSNITFVNGSASAGGALNYALYETSNFGMISNCVFKNCLATNYGGAVRVPDSGTFIDCTFEDCTASRGGAVDVTSTTAARFVNCTFVNCEATTEAGGAVYTDNNAATFERCAFTGNKASAAGKSAGAVRAAKQVVTFTDCGFTNNTAASAGAVDLGSMPASVTFARCSFVGNEATSGDVGAVNYGISGNETATFGSVYADCLFEGNTATGNAGAIRGLVQLATNTTFSGNQAGANGAVWHFNGYASGTYAGCYSLVNTFKDCTFTNNTAASGVFAANWNKKFLFDGCTFADNTVTGKGVLYAGADIIDFPLTFQDCTISGNKQADGSMLIETGNRRSLSGYTVVGSIFRNTTFAGNDVGAGSLYAHGEFPASFENCAITNNIGAWTLDFIGTPRRTVRNCLFADNTATNAVGGIICLEWQAAQHVIFENNTIVNNTADIAPYGVWTDSFLWQSGDQSLKNNLIYGNRGPGGFVGKQVPQFFDYQLYSSWVEQGGSSIADGTRGCIIGTDPKFAKPEQQAEFGVAKYSLRRNSAARGSGEVLDWMDENAKDLAGNARLRDGKVDMGCYQCWLDPAVGTLLLFR